MAFQFSISPTVRFKVEGAIADAKGVARNFSFWLTAQRLADTAAVKAYLNEMQACDSEVPITDTMLPRMTGWEEVKGPDGALMEWSDDNFRALMAVPGVAVLAHNAYLRESGAKEKN